MSWEEFGVHAPLLCLCAVLGPLLDALEVQDTVTLEATPHLQQGRRGRGRGWGRGWGRGGGMGKGKGEHETYKWRWSVRLNTQELGEREKVQKIKFLNI